MHLEWSDTRGKATLFKASTKFYSLFGELRRELSGEGRFHVHAVCRELKPSLFLSGSVDRTFESAHCTCQWSSRVLLEEASLMVEQPFTVVDRAEPCFARGFHGAQEKTSATCKEEDLLSRVLWTEFFVDLCGLEGF